METIAENLKIIKDSTADIKQAIIEKGGEVGNLTTYADAIRGIQTGGSSSFWTGHVDVEGLKAIGWDDDDIAYFQEHGVNWMAEDDEYYKVSDDNKALYGVINAGNYKDYKDRIIYMPKITITSSYEAFRAFKKLIAVPSLEFMQNTASLHYAFYQCYSLRCIPPILANNILNFNSAFRSCHGLLYIPPVNTSKGQVFTSMYNGCYYLEVLDELNISQAESADSVGSVIANCVSLVKVNNILDVSGLNVYYLATGCNSLVSIKLKNLSSNLRFNMSPNISKESILYIIENESASDSITIELSPIAYARLANDPDIVAALSNHPNVSLASA